MDIGDALARQNVPSEILEEWNRPVSERFPMRELGLKISSLCRKCPRDIILMIDEVDKSSDNQIFLSFLGLLREKYQKQIAGKEVTFDKKAAWTRTGILEAVRIILKEPNTLFDDMIKHLWEYPRLNTMLQNILFQGDGTHSKQMRRSYN